MRIVWIAQQHNLNLASYRLRCWYFHEELLKRGVSSEIYKGGAPPQADVAIFQKSFSQEDLELAQRLRDRGVTLVYNVSDIVPAGTDAFAGIANMLSLCDRVMVNGRALGEFFVDRHNPDWFVVEDPYDCQLPPEKHVDGGTEPAVFWHGPAKNYRFFVAPLEPSLQFDVAALSETTEPRWALDLFPDYARHYEIGFAPLPLHNPNVLGKSSNKIVGYMAMGLAVIASDHPSYRDVIDHGSNGFLGLTTDDFNEAYGELREPALRRSVARSGYESVIDRFSVATLTDKLLSALDTRSGGGE